MIQSGARQNGNSWRPKKKKVDNTAGVGDYRGLGIGVEQGEGDRPPFHPMLRASVDGADECLC